VFDVNENPWSREKNREFFSVMAKTFKFCPKIANSAFRAGNLQGISRELAGNFRFGGELTSTQTLAAFHAL
jgi:hypothetical protein